MSRTGPTGSPSFADSMRRCADAKNRHDVDDALVHFAADAVCLAMPSGHRVEGTDALRQFFSELWTAMPDYHLALDGFAADDDTGVSWGRATGTAIADIPGLVSAGTNIDTPVVFVCRFEDNRIVDELGYFDTGRVPGGEADPIQARARRFVERFTAGHASQDPQIFGELFHADCEVDYPTVDGALDRAGVVAFWESAWTLMPDLLVVPISWAAAGDIILIEWEAAGTLASSAVRWRGVDRFTLDGELAAAEGNYWDTQVLRAVTEPGAA